MFLKSLKISSRGETIREIPFHEGINLIVDESNEITGNNVGKTTVLKLVDFCLGANKKIIWIDPENPKETYDLVKNFLIDNDVLITLHLREDLQNADSGDVIIERNFHRSPKKVIRRIRGIGIIERADEHRRV